MSNQLVWDTPGERTYESGVDRGVLFLLDGTAIAWNGLTSVTEKDQKSSSSVYFDGVKINEFVETGDFEATLKAITYPKEFMSLDGSSRKRKGLYYGEQQTYPFHLCWRTRVANDLDSLAGYKIHIVYNATAVPSDNVYETLSDDSELMEFEWDISAVPEDTPGHSPTAYFVIDSTEVDPMLLAELEKMLYGTEFTLPALPTQEELLTYINSWCRFKVVDNGDGTVTLISFNDQTFEPGVLSDEIILSTLGVNITYLDDDSFIINTTCDISDKMKINVVDNGDGTWTASTEEDELFSVDVNNMFQISEIEANYLDAETYEFSSTPYDN